ncbi:MAG: ribonuclease III [Nostocoides sp.]
MRGNGGDAVRPVADLAEYLDGVTSARVDHDLLQRALTHRSYAYEAGGIPHNERLEFLGDSVLGIVVTDHLYRVHPDLTEGRLAKLRAATVNMRALAGVARTIGLGDYLHLGRGEQATGGRDKDSILADTTEAVIGTIYLSCGMAAAAQVIHSLLDPVMTASADLGAALDWKTSIQEIASELGLGSPTYNVENEGPEHAKTFTATVVIGGAGYGRGIGRTKKDAEQQAAEEGWRALRIEHGLSAEPDPHG